MKNLAIIPARGGSKRIPRKNIKHFLGKPIIAYSIEAALKSNLFNEIMVSTDDEEIARISRKYGANVPFFRSAENSSDYATTEDVILEVLSLYGEHGRCFDNVCCLYSTAPFVTADRLNEAFRKIGDDVDSVFAVVPYSYPIQRSLKFDEKNNINMVYPQFVNSRTQDLETIYHDAGQFYFSKVNAFTRSKNLWMDRTTALILPDLESQDLDTLTDWRLAEMKYKLLHGGDQ